MMYINANLKTIQKLAIRIDEYDQFIASHLQILNTHFDELGKTKTWDDGMCLTFANSQMNPLTQEIIQLRNSLDTEIRPFLAEVYRCLKDYYDAW